MASADELLFDPAQDYQVLEEFEIEEDIQRPEEIRFYTYEQQASDFIERLLPKTGKIPKAVIRKAEYEVDSFTKLYTQVVKDTAEGFVEAKYERPATLSWVHYKNGSRLESTEFMWKQAWNPLFPPSPGTSPNYYLMLIDSLPKSPRYFTGGDGVPVYDMNRKVQIENTIFLDNVQYTKTLVREDGTYTIAKVTRADTKDTATFTKYAVDNPPLAPPNPLVDHPFLSVHPDPVLIDSTEPLQELLPSMEAIFEHAVPETGDPYTEGLKYLKIYDIRLKDIPEKLWTSKFPPVPVVDETPPPKDITLPAKEEDAPSKQILEAYGTPWKSSLSSRKWLVDQVDGGMLVPKMFLSQAGDVGVAAVPPPVIFPDAGVIEGTPDDCLPADISGFTDFQTRGVYRAPKCAVCGATGHSGFECPDKKSKDKEYKPGYGCIPISFIHKEQEDAPYHGKEPWTPGTDARILKEHQERLQKYREYPEKSHVKIPAATPSSASNETRRMIVSILEDETKLSDDKLYDIQALIKDSPISNHLYLDSETGAFLICEHELHILSGDYARDPKKYLKTWCVRDSGFYICQYSGERIAEVLEEQAVFDENGRQIMRGDVVTTSAALLTTSDHHTFAESLKSIQTAFKTDEPAEDIMYLILTLIQVLPEQEKLRRYLEYVRGETSKIRRAMTGKRSSGEIDLVLGAIGFSATVILLQTHVPQLIPRRSFGSKPLQLNGFPRDETDSNNAPLIDSLLFALQTTFEQYPSTFKGSSVVFLRAVLKDRKSIKRTVMTSLKKQFVPEFKDELQLARDTLDSETLGDNPIQSFSPPAIHPNKDVSFLKPEDSIVSTQEERYFCKSVTPWLMSSTGFSFVQKELPIVLPLKPAAQSRIVEAEKVDEPAGTPDKAKVSSLLKLKPIKSTAIQSMLKEESPAILQSFLLRSLSILSTQSTADQTLRTYLGEAKDHVVGATGNSSLLRDFYKGLILDLGKQIADNGAVLSVLEKAWASDPTFVILRSKTPDLRKDIDSILAKERTMFRNKLRAMPDPQREITKKLIDLHLAPYLITKEDRESFVQEMQAELDTLEPPTDNPLVAGEEDRAAPENIPEEGLNDDRDNGEQGEVPLNADGIELLTDYGDYGDRRARALDGEDAPDQAAYDYDEDF
jgi:hypothetical protein